MIDFNIGFTGARTGMTQIQKTMVTTLLKNYEGLINVSALRCHHGDCVGSDEQFHDLAYAVANTLIMVYPSTDEKLRAFCFGKKPHPPGRVFESAPKPYLTRNRDIVKASQFLIACPNGKEQLRSGTWSTIRYARKKQKLGIIIYPEGTTETMT